MPLPEALGDVLRDAEPVATQAGVGVVAGYCAGRAARFGLRATATLAGAAFLAVQALAYNGYIHVNWAEVQRSALPYFDVDGDGEITSKDARLLLQRLESVLKFGLPGDTGFGTGFAFAVTGRVGRAVAGGLTAATFAGLAGAHAYSHDDDVAQRVRAVAPGLAQQLDATLVTHSPYARLVDELRDAGNGLASLYGRGSRVRQSQGLAALRQEEAKLAAELRQLHARSAHLNGPERSRRNRLEADLRAIEEAKKAAKAALRDAEHRGDSNGRALRR